MHSFVYFWSLGQRQSAASLLQLITRNFRLSACVQAVNIGKVLHGLQVPLVLVRKAGEMGIQNGLAVIVRFAAIFLLSILPPVPVASFHRHILRSISQFCQILLTTFQISAVIQYRSLLAQHSLQR